MSGAFHNHDTIRFREENLSEFVRCHTGRGAGWLLTQAGSFSPNVSCVLTGRASVADYSAKVDFHIAVGCVGILPGPEFLKWTASIWALCRVDSFFVHGSGLGLGE
jgi:hypothetical protein